MRARLVWVVAAVALLNLLAGGGALALGGFGVAGLGVGMIAYLLGVRHAFDADHIAAIDNVTRRLRAAGERPVGVGLFFSLGHSTVVLLLTAAAVVAARHVGAVLPQLSAWGSLFGSVVSAGFLTLIGLANLRFFAARLRERHGARRHDHEIVWGRVGHRVDHSWKMFPLGMLFGLSFDTASEVALLAISVAAAHDSSIPVWGVMLLPLLFTAGMASTDTLESLLMLRLYDWAIADRDRTLAPQHGRYRSVRVPRPGRGAVPMDRSVQPAARRHAGFAGYRQLHGGAAGHRSAARTRCPGLAAAPTPGCAGCRLTPRAARPVRRARATSGSSATSRWRDAAGRDRRGMRR